MTKIEMNFFEKILPQVVIRHKGALYGLNQSVDHLTGRLLTSLKHLPLNLTYVKRQRVSQKRIIPNKNEPLDSVASTNKN